MILNPQIKVFIVNSRINNIPTIDIQACISIRDWHHKVSRGLPKTTNFFHDDLASCGLSTGAADMHEITLIFFIFTVSDFVKKKIIVFIFPLFVKKSGFATSPPPLPPSPLTHTLSSNF